MSLYKVTQRRNNFSNFHLVTDYIYQESGITDLDKRALTSALLQQYAESQTVFTSQDFLQKMKNSKLFYQEILNVATVNETFFMREVKELEWLIAYIKKAKKTLNILSLPCSSGEEVYSILIMMQEAGIPFSKVKIKGYDINSYALELAQRGEYKNHSLHKLSPKILSKYFIFEKKDTYLINAMFKKAVSFHQKNIFTIDTNKEKYDIVLSRNMFIYFDNKKRTLALSIIIELLKSGAIYIKGHADTIISHQELQQEAYGIYSKISLLDLN